MGKYATKGALLAVILLVLLLGSPDIVAGGTALKKGLADDRQPTASIDSVGGTLIPYTYSHIGWPTHTPHGVQLDTQLVLYNYGSEDCYFAINPEEDTGPSGWLAVSGFEGGYIPGGPPYRFVEGAKGKEH